MKMKYFLFSMNLYSWKDAKVSFDNLGIDLVIISFNLINGFHSTNFVKMVLLRTNRCLIKEEVFMLKTILKNLKYLFE